MTYESALFTTEQLILDLFVFHDLFNVIFTHFDLLEEWVTFPLAWETNEVFNLWKVSLARLRYDCLEVIQDFRVVQIVTAGG